MTKNELDELFESLKDKCDIHEPNKGHKYRFADKLKDANTEPNTSKQLMYLWKPLLAIAACVVVFLGIYSSTNSRPLDSLASVSPQLAEAQEFFTATINEELKTLEAQRSPLTENIIYKAERQLKALEQDYKALQRDLKESGHDRRVVYAMITNFQNRIEILESILDQIEELKKIENETDNTL